MTKIDSDDVLKQIITTEEKVIIYGAGNYGKTLNKYLKKRFDYEIEWFVVSKEKDNEKNIEGKEVHAISGADINKIIIIAVSEQKQEELIDNAKKLGYEKIYTVLNDFIRYIQSELIDDRLSVRKSLGFEVHLTEHCNLNCKGCYHFSPLAKEEFLDLNEYEHDLYRLRELFDKDVDKITLLGGEPLLHKDIVRFITVSRDLFPDCRLEILTNGILLGHMSGHFWEACKKNKVALCCTKYPIHVDYDAIELKANTYGLKIGYHNDVGAGEKTLIKYPFDDKGEQDGSVSFFKCTRSNLCITLKHGRLYTCPMAAHAHLAKDYFEMSMELSDDDYIDIYRAKDMNEIMSFFTKPIPFCRYCNLSKRPEQMKWSISKKDYKEWF